MYETELKSKKNKVVAHILETMSIWYFAFFSENGKELYQDFVKNGSGEKNKVSRCKRGLTFETG